MRPRFLSFSIMLVSWLAAGPTTGIGQSQSPAAQPSSTGAPGNTSPGQAPAASKPTPVKVWTNDDIATVPRSHGNTVIHSHEFKNVSTTAKPLREKDASWYRKQLVPLNTEIERLDPKIARLKAFLSGEMVSDPPTTHRQLVPSPKDQLKEMETKRNADAAKIEDLLDRARHNGIEPGQLR